MDVVQPPNPEQSGGGEVVYGEFGMMLVVLFNLLITWYVVCRLPSGSSYFQLPCTASR